MRERSHLLHLDISHFQCPISLEVMLSPVILCTGVTYDRSSITRWLDSGNTTCPATMQPLPSTDLLPNLTLRRLIRQTPPPLDLDGLVAVLKTADDSSSRVAAARLIELRIADEKTVIARKPELVAELLRLVRETDGPSVDAGLRCLIRVVGAGAKVRVEMARMGAVALLTSVMERDGVGISVTVADMAMRVLEATVGCREGKAAFCAEAERCVAAVVGRMMEVGNEGREAAVALLWRVCCAGGGDGRARKAAAFAKEGLGKMLVVMQADCSPLTRKLAGDLVKVCRENCKGSLVVVKGYDSRIIHIRPY